MRDSIVPSGALRPWAILAATVVVAAVWVIAGFMISVGVGLTDAPTASTVAVMIVAWLPVPMAIAAIADVARREFGGRGRDGTVPRTVARSFVLWLVAVGACLLA